ncbi:hypothetical protein [Bradyrhizobium sp.]|uniref:hypothetical protein n=1 Tax=Bradyrhizobium sp. TaxID=376 RepID=UPI00262C3205|nr:hypothetical protein [Bradyrhizobium sp.]
MTTNPVLAALAQARLRAAPVFARWCETNGASFCPAHPATVAKFVSDCGSLGIARLWPAVQDISKMHVTLGLADPTLGAAVAAAISEVAGFAAPRAWPEYFKQRFKSLPYDVQLFIVEHEAGREKALRRAQNEAAALRRKLAEVQKPRSETKAGIQADEVKGSNADIKSSA